MKRAVLFLFVVAGLASCQAGIFGQYVTGNGVSVEIPMETGDFNAISVRGMVDVYYSQADGAPSVLLTADENLVDYYDISVEDNTLVVRVKPSTILRTKAKTFVTVTSSELCGVKVSGSGDCQVNGGITVGESFEIKVSGSGHILVTGDISCDSFSTTISGSGDVELSGVKASSAVFKSSGSGEIEAGPVTAESLSVSSSGSGDISLSLKDAGFADVRISGSGDIELDGSLADYSIKDSGSGEFVINGRRVR